MHPKTKAVSASAPLGLLEAIVGNSLVAKEPCKQDRRASQVIISVVSRKNSLVEISSTKLIHEWRPGFRVCGGKQQDPSLAQPVPTQRRFRATFHASQLDLFTCDRL